MMKKSVLVLLTTAILTSVQPAPVLAQTASDSFSQTLTKGAVIVQTLSPLRKEKRTLDNELSELMLKKPILANHVREITFANGWDMKGLTDAQIERMGKLLDEAAYTWPKEAWSMFQGLPMSGRGVSSVSMDNINEVLKDTDFWTAQLSGKP